MTSRTAAAHTRALNPDRYRQNPPCADDRSATSTPAADEVPSTAMS
ncbi:hypothetical protein [Nocardia gamkensis]